MAGSFLGFFAFVSLPFLISPSFHEETGVLQNLIANTGGSISMLLLPASIGIAILRHRLWDIDIVISRTLVYGALTGMIVRLYALIVGGLGTLLRIEGNPVLSLLAAGVIAVAFAPLRDRLQRGVNRLLYGERDEPYVVLSRLGRRVEQALAPESVLVTVVETVAQALRLPYVAITLRQEDGFVTAAEYGSRGDDLIDLPLVYGSDTVGQLLLPSARLASPSTRPTGGCWRIWPVTSGLLPTPCNSRSTSADRTKACRPRGRVWSAPARRNVAGFGAICTTA